MLVTTLKHAALVKKRLENYWRLTGRRYFSYDTETKPRSGFEYKDGLVIGRADISFWSMCFQGEAYSFPTSYFASRFLDPEDWADFYLDWFLDQSIIKVMHNANYDLNVLHYSKGIPTVRNIWDTMIARWKTCEYKEKSLKDSAPAYGRIWRLTKTVNFSDLNEVAEYAEMDVIQTDELFQNQYYGRVVRPKTIVHVNPEGKYVSTPQVLPVAPFTIKDEVVRPFDRLWLRYLEFPVLRATIRAERRGFPIDVIALRKIRRNVNKDLQESLKTMYRMAGKVINLNSGKQLSEVCATLGIINPHKTDKGAESWGAHALQKMKGVHPFTDALISYKALQKLSSVYIGTKDLDPNDYKNADCGLEYYVSPVDGGIHCTMGTVAAVTGRNSASNPNLQQIPSRKDKYGIKSVFTAYPVNIWARIPKRFRRDAQLIVLDYSQLEIRVMALLCKDKAMSKILSDPKGDIHQHTADQFGVARDPQAKNLNFLLLYGGGAYMLSETLTFQGVPVSKTECAEYIERHKLVYPRVSEFRFELLQEHQKNGFVQLFCGRRRTLPDIDWEDERSIHKAETTLSNNVVQGSGQDFLKAAIIRADPGCISPDRELPKRMEMSRSHRLYLADKAKQIEKYRKTLKSAEARFRLQVHDEAIFTSIPSASEECLHILADIMSWRHYFPSISGYNVPLVAEGGVGPTWKDAKSKDKYLFHCKAGFEDWKKYAN
jgi:DNA polymerase I-like protein with 3'-5' exonuclease and polymerase domains